jgi:catechol 1,2-dioxygenase
MTEARTEAIVRDLLRRIGELVDEHTITHGEYRAAVAFLDEAARAGETTLLFDAFLEADVVDRSSRSDRGTTHSVLGPYYLEGAPLLEKGLLAGDDEPGERLTLVGMVRGLDGAPLAGATLDFWQADAAGRYGGFDAEPAMKLRGRMRSGEDGRYELRTVMPAAYQIPHDGPTGRLLAAIGRHPWRPPHVHLKASHEGHRTLITQIYFADTEYLDSDAVRAVRPSLIRPCEPSAEGLRASFDVILEPV